MSKRLKTEHSRVHSVYPSTLKKRLLPERAFSADEIDEDACMKTDGTINTLVKHDNVAAVYQYESGKPIADKYVDMANRSDNIAPGTFGKYDNMLKTHSLCLVVWSIGAKAHVRTNTRPVPANNPKKKSASAKFSSCHGPLGPGAYASSSYVTSGTRTFRRDFEERSAYSITEFANGKPPQLANYGRAFTRNGPHAFEDMFKNQIKRARMWKGSSNIRWHTSVMPPVYNRRSLASAPWDPGSKPSANELMRIPLSLLDVPTGANLPNPLQRQAELNAMPEYLDAVSKCCKVHVYDGAPIKTPNVVNLTTVSESLSVWMNKVIQDHALLADANKGFWRTVSNANAATNKGIRKRRSERAANMAELDQSRTTYPNGVDGPRWSPTILEV